MAEAVCGWCGKPTYMSPVQDKLYVVGHGEYTGGFRSQRPYVCANCKHMSIATWWTSYDPSEDYRSGEPESYDEVRWSPSFIHGQSFADVPSAIASAASEAYVCQSAGAYRGAVAIARAVVEASARESGAEESDLYGMISGLYERRLIREHIMVAAHEVRHLGNEVAHGEFVLPVSEEECAEILGLMAELLRELFQSPAEVGRLKEARLSKKAKT